MAQTSRFSYKHPKAVPARADIEKQEEFIEKYRALISETPVDEPILFMDSAHPTRATKGVCSWIKKGTDKPRGQTASRTRVNVTDAIGLAEMKVTSCYPDYVNAETTVAFFDLLKAAYPDAPALHIIPDQSGYHLSKLVREAASEKNSELHQTFCITVASGHQLRLDGAEEPELTWVNEDSEHGPTSDHDRAVGYARSLLFTALQSQFKSDRTIVESHK